MFFVVFFFFFWGGGGGVFVGFLDLAFIIWLFLGFWGGFWGGFFYCPQTIGSR